MGSGPVVVVHVHAKHALEVTAVQDQQPVEALRTNGAHPALGEGVGLGRAHGRANDLDILGGEHGVEGVGELGVSVADEEPNRPIAVRHRQEQVASCWVTHGPVGLAVTPPSQTRRDSSSMKDRT